jgi:hypothetical protein
MIRVAASFCAAGVNRWTLTRLVLCLTKLLDGARGDGLEAGPRRTD